MNKKHSFNIGDLVISCKSGRRGIVEAEPGSFEFHRIKWDCGVVSHFFEAGTNLPELVLIETCATCENKLRCLIIHGA